VPGSRRRAPPARSINDIAAAADVSRRTVYVHFATLDQLILDATLGLMNVDVDAGWPATTRATCAPGSAS